MKKLLVFVFGLITTTALSQIVFDVDLQQIAVGNVNGPEAIAFDDNGLMYTANEDGRIIVLNSDGSNSQDFTQTGGRPLGLKFDSNGNLIVADAFQGLLSIDTAGQISVLTTGYGGLPFLLTDDLDIGSDGTIYFSDASSVNNLNNLNNDWGQPNGRLLSYNPNTGVTNLLLDNLYFASFWAPRHACSFSKLFLFFHNTSKVSIGRGFGTTKTKPWTDLGLAASASINPKWGDQVTPTSASRPWMIG